MPDNSEHRVNLFCFLFSHCRINLAGIHSIFSTIHLVSITGISAKKKPKIFLDCEIYQIFNFYTENLQFFNSELGSTISGLD